MNMNTAMKEGVKKLISVIAEQLIIQGNVNAAADVAEIGIAINSEGSNISKMDLIFNKYNHASSQDTLALIDLVATIASQDKSDEPVEEIRTLSGSVDNIHVHGSMLVRISQGDNPGIKVHSHNAITAKEILTEVIGNTLSIKQTSKNTVVFSGGRGVTQIISGSNHIIAGGDIITNGRRVAFDLGGMSVGASVEFSSNYNQDFVEVILPRLNNISVHGSAMVDASNLNLSELNVMIQGSGRLTINGCVNHLSATVQGSGAVRSKEASIATAQLSVQGSGSIKSNVTERVSAAVSGSGLIIVYGSPLQRSESVAGSGKIKFK